ncbi:transcriptional regulator with GAF, ATPase, and Fis domain [Arthrobacter sp. PL16]|uniref:GAF and ANTAR domain-containing protein n=1 Tax=Arthrobacter sp. PL16 TaxID=3071720 RepID=UPI002DFB7395|nr:transcriptional regulator with GAF, ATPase, and Fis domain [Arthrobacter sp. PL16]
MDSEPTLNELAVVFGRVRGLLLTEETVQHAVDLLAEAARDLIPGAIGAGVSLIHHGQRTSTGATDALVRRADELQYELSEGPCLSAWSTSTPVRTDDTTALDQRWPRWAAAAAGMSVRSCQSVPLIQGDTTIGAMKVYATEAFAFDGTTERALTRFAVPAAALLSHVQTTDTPQQIRSDLSAALQTRDRIAMAKGILMARLGIDDRAAFAELVTRARDGRCSVGDVALELTEGAGRPAT